MAEPDADKPTHSTIDKGDSILVNGRRLLFDGIVKDGRFASLLDPRTGEWRGYLPPDLMMRVESHEVDAPDVSFESGQTVYEKTDPTWTFTIAEDGYYDHRSMTVFQGVYKPFTSEHYGLVEETRPEGSA